MENSPPIVRVIYDCNVFLQGLIAEPSPGFGCLQLVANDTVQMYISREIHDEVRSVLLRPKLQDKFPRLTYERVASLFRMIEEKATLIDAVPTHFRYERDIKDEPYLNLAIAANANYIVSRDNDLLDLMKENLPPGKEFRSRYPTISILDPVEYLRQFEMGN